MCRLDRVCCQDWIKSKRVHQVTEVDSVKKTKLIRFLGQFSSQRTSLVMGMSEKQDQ
jgi:hypothetical protein